MRRLWENRFARGLALIALVSLGIVLLFLLWRERRSDIETWSALSRRTFYGAIVLAVLAIGALIGLGPTGADAIAFFAVIACCAWAIVRVWRREHRYG